MRKNIIRTFVIVTLSLLLVAITIAVAQEPARGGGQGRGGGRGPAGPVLTVTSSAWPDGGEVPQKHAGRGGNMSPAFEFNWVQAGNPAMPPATLMSYAIIFHDIENAPRGGEPDTLHWMIWDIPGTARG